MAAFAVTTGIIIIRMRNELLDLFRVLTVNINDLIQVPSQDDTTREFEIRYVGIPVGREVTIAEVIGQPATNGAPVVFVKRGHGQQVRNVNLVNEGMCFIEQASHHGQAFGIDGVVLIDIDGTCGTTNQVVWMGVLAAKNGMDLNDLLLPFQCFEVVGYPNEVNFSREFIGRVAPIAIGENSQLSAGYKSFQTLLKV